MRIMAGILKEFLEKKGDIHASPAVITRFSGYNRRITNGKNTHSQKTGLANATNTRKPLTANLRELDLLLTPNYTSLVYLTSGSSQHPVREKQAFSHNH